MKPRTKITYNTNKREEFDYVERTFKKVYDRFVEIVVTADTEAEALDVLDQIRDTIEKNTFKECQRCYCNDEVKLDEKTNKWVAWELVNLDTKEEYEEVKEAYMNWKEEFKNSSSNKKEEPVNGPELPMITIVETDDNFSRLYDEKCIDVKIIARNTELTQKYLKEFISYCTANNIECSCTGRGTRGNEITYLEATIGLTTTDSNYLEQLTQARKVVRDWIELVNSKKKKI